MLLLTRPQLQPVVIWLLVSPLSLSSLSAHSDLWPPTSTRHFPLRTNSCSIPIFSLSCTLLCGAQWWMWHGEYPTASAAACRRLCSPSLAPTTELAKPSKSLRSLFFPNSDVPVWTFSESASPAPSLPKCLKLPIGWLDICVQTSSCA